MMRRQTPPAKILARGNVRLVGERARIVTHRNALLIEFASPLELMRAIKRGQIKIAAKDNE